jgi:hypothetical protein
MSARASSSFPLGQIVATANALAQITKTDIDAALQRHVIGDWRRRARAVQWCIRCLSFTGNGFCCRCQ